MKRILQARRSIFHFLFVLIATSLSFTARAQFNYGTGLIASNAAPFATAGGTNITVSGNDITVTGNVTILTNGANAGIYNFHNLTINAGATVTVSGGSNPLIIRCTGTFTNNGILTAAGGDGLATVAGTTTSDWGGAHAACTTTGSLPGGVAGAGGGGWGGAGGTGGIAGGTSLAGFVSGSTPKGGTGTNFTGAGSSGVAGGGNGGKPSSPIVAGAGGSYGAAGGASSGTSGGTFATAGSTYGGSVTLGGPQIDGIRNLWGGCGGGGGGGRLTSCVALTSTGGSGGGGGGGAIRVTANSIVLQSSGTSGLITVRGGNGGGNRAGTSIGTGAGGAGSGGTIHLQYGGSGTLTYAGSATINGATATDVTAGVNFVGGTGGNCASGFTVGGNGGAGRYLAEQDVASCSAPIVSSTANGAATSVTACNATPVALAASASNCSGGTMTYSWSTGAGQYWNGTNFSGASASFLALYANITTTPASNSNTTYTVTGTCSLVTCTGSSTVSVTTTALATYDYGTGAEGSYTAPAGSSTLSGTHNYINFTVPSGSTVTAAGNAPLIIKCMGDATINGILTAAGGNGSTGGNFTMPSTPAPGGNGGAGGGGGWGAAGGTGGTGVVCCTAGTGVNGTSFGSSAGRGVGGTYYTGAGTIQGGTGGSYGTAGSAAPAGSGGAANNTVGSTYGDAALATSMTSNSITTALLGGSGGGGGGARDQSVSSTAIAGGDGGGGGGGAIRITAYNINITSTGLVSVRGGNGATGNTNGTGAGGGGSAGTLHLQYGTSLLYNGSATINGASGTDVANGVNIAGGTGGNAGTGYTQGGAGGQGRYLAQLDPNPCLTCTAPILTAKANSTATSITVCSSGVALSTNPSSGGFGCTGTFQYAWGDGTHYWNGTNLTTATSPVYSASYATITVTPAASTTITYTALGQCSSNLTCTSTSAVTVTTVAQPTVAFTGGNTSVCTGASVSLTQNVSNGVGTPTYLWETATTSGGPYTAASGTNNTASYTVPVASAGTNWYSLSVTYPVATGCSSALPAGQSVAVAAQPASGTLTPTPAAGTVCSGVTLSATATAGSNGNGSVADLLQYQYDNNGTWIAYTSGTGIATVGHTSVDIRTYRTATGSNCSSSTPNTVTWTISTSANTWTGSVSNDWFTPGNWSCGFVPTATTNVLIPTVATTYPSITGAAPASPNALTANLTINNGASLTVVGANGANLEVHGNLANSGTLAMSAVGSVLTNGTGTQTLSGVNTFTNLKINNNTTITSGAGNMQSISGTLSLVNGTLTTNDNLTLLSAAVNQAAIIDNFTGTNGGIVSGTVYAQRYYNSTVANSYNQHFMGSPVSAPLLSQFGSLGTNGGYIIPLGNCDETKSKLNTPYGIVFSYDETHNTGCGISQWKVETSGNAANGVGYSILKNGIGTLTLNGTPNLSNSYTISALGNSSWSNTTLQGRTITSGWHLLSNPYQAELLISSASATANYAGGAGFDQNIQIWYANGTFAGSYQPGVPGTTAVLAPFQAFMVHKTTTGGATGYTINGSDRVATAGTFYRTANSNGLTITAANTATGKEDKTVVAFNKDASDHFDGLYDADKLPGALDRHTLYTINDNKWMAINVLHAIEETATVPVGFEPGIDGAYTFTFDGIGQFDPTSYVTLEDKQLNLMHDVRSGSYSFTAKAADDWNRFVLHFTPPAIVTTADGNCESKGTLNIQQPGNASWSYTLANAANTEEVITMGSLNVNAPVNTQLPSGVYILTLKDINGYTAVKNIYVNGVQTVAANFTPSVPVAHTGDDVVFNNHTVGAANYLWQLGDGTTSAEVNPVHSYTNAGEYEVTLQAQNSNCQDMFTQTVKIEALATGINGVNGSGILISGLQSKVTIAFSNYKDAEVKVVVYDVMGRKLAENDHVNAATDHYTMNLNNIAAGYYFVHVTGANTSVAQKVLLGNE